MKTPGQARALGALRGLAEKGLPVGANDDVKDAALGVAWAVGCAREGHVPQLGLERDGGQCRKGDTPCGSGAR